MSTVFPISRPSVEALCTRLQNIFERDRRVPLRDKNGLVTVRQELEALIIEIQNLDMSHQTSGELLRGAIRFHDGVTRELQSLN